MKRIVIACDGTWNRLDAACPTNVAKLAQAVLAAGPDGVAQVTYHLDGVGTGRGTGWLARGLDRVLGGMFGQGLMATIEEAYRFLVFAYAPGDEIFLFGFSRGAYTARSLAGLIRNSGILERAHAAAIPQALALYRARSAATGPDSAAACAFRARYAGHVTTGAAEADWRAARGLPAGLALRLRYLGVWDTVGALGLPGHLRLAAWLNRGLALPRHRAVAERDGSAARGGDRRAAPDLSADALGQPRGPEHGGGGRALRAALVSGRPRLGRRRRRGHGAVRRRAGLDRRGGGGGGAGARRRDGD